MIEETNCPAHLRRGAFGIAILPVSIRQSDRFLTAKIDALIVALDLVAELGDDGVVATRRLVELERNALTGGERLGELRNKPRLITRGSDFQGDDRHEAGIRDFDLRGRLGGLRSGWISREANGYSEAD